MIRLIFMLFILTAAISPGCQEEPAAQSQSPTRPRPNLEKWQAAFKRADKIEIFSILPIYGDTTDRPKFNKWPIVASAIITDTAEKEKLYKLLEEFIYDVPLQKNDKVTACKFAPHHGLSFIDKSGSHDIVICFTCDQVMTKSISLPTYFGDLRFSNEAFEELEGILKAHGIETFEERALRRKKERS